MKIGVQPMLIKSQYSHKSFIYIGVMRSRCKKGIVKHSYLWFEIKLKDKIKEKYSWKLRKFYIIIFDNYLGHNKKKILHT